MTADGAESNEIARAAGGDRAVLERLLLGHYDRLAADVSGKLPREFRGLLSPDDVLQETFVVAFREIGHFQPQGPEAFYHWLATIAQHRLWDLVKGLRAAKRGGGRVAVEAHAHPDEASLGSLLGLLNVNEHTPSGSAANHEAVAAVRTALAALKEDYREALRLRYIEGLPVVEVAARMNRTDRAVHMLCHRGLERLHEILGRSSQYFSRK